MIAIAFHAAVLAAIYLLVLTSLAPGDVVVGAALGLAVAVALRERDAGVARDLARMLPATLREMVVGSWRTARFCLGDRAHPGVVELPRLDRTPEEVAVWGVLTGESPDEVVVDVDEERDLLLVHLVDASDPDAVRARHARGRKGLEPDA